MKINSELFQCFFFTRHHSKENKKINILRTDSLEQNYLWGQNLKYKIYLNSHYCYLNFVIIRLIKK